jgi:hypothetical protein
MNTKSKDVFQYALAGIVILGFFVVVYLMLYATIPVANQGPLNIIVGGLITGFATVISYFFGSSKGSQAKDDIIANSVSVGDLTQKLSDIGNDVKNQIAK